MTRTELIDDLASRTGMDKKEVKRVPREPDLARRGRRSSEGGEVPLKGLGKFKVQHRKARIGRNPITGSRDSDPGQDRRQVHDGPVAEGPDLSRPREAPTPREAAGAGSASGRPGRDPAAVERR